MYYVYIIIDIFNEPYSQLRHKIKWQRKWGTLYREPMGRLVLRYKKSKNLSDEAYNTIIARNNKNQPNN